MIVRGVFVDCFCYLFFSIVVDVLLFGSFLDKVDNFLEEDEVSFLIDVCNVEEVFV